MNHTTSAEFITRELHSMVYDPAVYDWGNVWAYLRNHTDAIHYDPATQGFCWNDKNVYMQDAGALTDLVDSYALDRTVSDERYVTGKLWTRRTTLNAATGSIRSVTYITDVHIVTAVYDPDGTPYAIVGSTYDGKPLHDADAAWTETETAWKA